MTTEITYRHYCNLGALNNKGCFSRVNSKTGLVHYYYHGILANASWQGQTMRTRST